MRSNILRGSFIPGPSSGVPPLGDGLCWHKRGFAVEGRRASVESRFTVILWSSLSSLFNLPNRIHFERWPWNFPMSASCASPLSFLTVVAFLILGQLLGPYVVCHPARLTFPVSAKCLLWYGSVLKSPFLLRVEPRAPCRVGTTTEVPTAPAFFFSWDWVRSVA